MADPVNEWKEYRKVASQDSAIVGSKGISPAWSIDSHTARDFPILVGDSSPKLDFSPLKPEHARTPFAPPAQSSMGRQSVVADHGRLKSEPAISFYGRFGSDFSNANVEKQRAERGSNHAGGKVGVWGGRMLDSSSASGARRLHGEGATVRAPGHTGPGPGAHNLGRKDVDCALGKQVNSLKRTATRQPMAEETYLEGRGLERLEKALAEATPNPGPGAYHTAPTVETRVGAFKVSESTLNQPTSAYTSMPAYSLGGNGAEMKDLKVPGAGSYEAGKTVTLPLAQGKTSLIRGSTFGVTINSPSPPAASLSLRQARHASRKAKAEETRQVSVGDRKAYREATDKLTKRHTTVRSGGEIPTEMRMAVYSSFGGQRNSGQNCQPSFTMRQLHTNQNKLTMTDQDREFIQR